MLAERLVTRVLGEDVERALHVLGQRTREHFLELLECRCEIGVVLVRVADHQPCREDDRHRLVQGQLERRQELLADHAPEAALRPDGDANFLLQRPQIAVDGPGGDADPTGDLGGPDPVGVATQDGDDAEHPCKPVALPEALGPVLEGHGPGG